MFGSEYGDDNRFYGCRRIQTLIRRHYDVITLIVITYANITPARLWYWRGRRRLRQTTYVVTDVIHAVVTYSISLQAMLTRVVIIQLVGTPSLLLVVVVTRQNYYDSKELWPYYADKVDYIAMMA